MIGRQASQSMSGNGPACLSERTMILLPVLLLFLPASSAAGTGPAQKTSKETSRGISDIERRLDEADAHYDIDEAQHLREVIKATLDPRSFEYNYFMARTYEIISVATDTQKNDRTREDEIFAIRALGYIAKALRLDPDHSDSHRLFSEMLTRRIYGPATGMTYDAIALEALDKAVALDPTNDRATLRRAVNFLERPLNHGGDRDAGRRLLNALERRNPDNSRVLYYLGYYYQQKGDIRTEREYLEKARQANPCEYRALRALREMAVQARRLRIHRLTLRNKTQTAPALIQRKLTPFVGRVFTEDVKDAIVARLSDIPTVDGVSFFYNEVADGLIIDCLISEDTLSVVSVMLGLSISLDYHRKTNWFTGEAPSVAFGALYYETNNFLRTGDFFSITTMGVYNDILYQHYFPSIDLRLGFVSNLMPGPKVWYAKGRLLGPEPYRYIDLLGELGIGKSFEGIFDLFLMQAFRKAFFTRTHTGFTPPAEAVTSSTYIDAAFRYIAHHEPLWVMDGYLVELRPELITKPGYRSWGDDTARFHERQWGMFKLFCHLGIYKAISKKLQLREDIFYLYAHTPYYLELFAVGKGAAPDPFGLKLRGFYQEEFLTGHALVTNTYLSLPVLPKRARVGFFYDHAIFIDSATRSAIHHKHSVGGQLMVKLPWEMAVTFQCAFGLNADRRRLPGTEIDIYLSRLFVR